MNRSLTSLKDNPYIFLYFFGYFGLGALLPLLSIYLESIGFSGVQIGFISSIRSVLAIFSPPLWGLLSDRFSAHKPLLILSFLATLLVGFFLPFIYTFLLFCAFYGLFSFFQTASTPLADSIALHSPLPFGSIRKWGAYGFAIAALITGYIADATFIKIIFLIFSFSILMAIYFSTKLSVSIPREHHAFKQDLPELFKNKLFLVFLVYCFLVGNTILSHNTFFGPLFLSLGGSSTWVGIAFFLFALSEAPFMEWSNKLISRFGVYNVLLFSTCVAIFRWSFFFFKPSVFLIILTFPLQGLFFGTFIASTAHFIKTTLPSSVRSTAVTIYSAVFIGIGGAFSNIVGGYIYDYINIESVYGFFALLCTLGLVLLFFIRKQLTH